MEKFEKKDQEEIKIIFQEYIAKNYLKRFKKLKILFSTIKNQKKLVKNIMLVKTDLIVDKEEVSINYLLLFDQK